MFAPHYIGMGSGGGASSLIALVANAHAINAGGVATTAAIDTTGANLLIAAVACNNASPTVTDSKGNAWTLISTQTQGAWYTTLAFYKCEAPTSVGAGHTFSNNDVQGSICVAAFSGVKAASPADGSTGSSGAGAGAWQPGAITPSANGDLLVSAIAYDNNPTVSIDSAFTKIEDSGSGGGTAVGTALAYKIQGPAATENPIWSAAPAADLETAMAAFKSA